MSRSDMSRSVLTGLAFALALSAAPVAIPEASAHPRAVVVRVAPPPLRREAIIVAPGPRERFVWVDGYWRWDGRGYDWVPGRWVDRPHRYHAWVPGHWAPVRGGWVWRDGHWR